jgi:hypothetical protein
MGFHSLVNTAYFSEAANDFRKNGGRYTTAPIGSRDYHEYWEEQEKRCRQGYKVGGLWIPGRKYHWLNFTPIMKVDDKIAIKAFEERRSAKTGKVGRLTAERILDFPRFYEIHYEWYNFKHIAWYGGTFMGVQSPGAKHICCGKSRGAGFSYMEAQDGVYNYTFIPGSKSYYFAGIEQYLTTDGIMNKVQPMLDFTNQYIHEWKQNRQKKDTMLHRRASYVDSFGMEQGSFAEIIGVVVDDPDKTRGKRGRKVTFEEAGSFRNLKKALNVSIGSIKDGDICVGQISVFGTGGEEGPDIEGLEDIFNDPQSFDMLEFPNVWEAGYEGTSCGYFVPVWRTKSTFMDAEGNVDVAGSIKSELVIRKQKKKAKDPKVLDGYKAEYPFSPKDMFRRLKKNIFDRDAVDAQIRLIETNVGIQQMLRYGRLRRDEKEGVVFDIMGKHEAKPVETYPHNQEDDLEGCVTICNRPFTDQHGHVPEGLYQITFDPYYKEEAEDLTSLFSCTVWKQYNSIDPVDEGLPIAWYVGRPQQIETAYRNLFMLADYYNCTVQGEVAGGGQGVIDYAKRPDIKLLHKVEYEPLMMHNKEFTSSQAMKNRSLLMNMPTEKKRLGLTYLANWHLAPRGFTEKGNPILNIHRIYHIGLLREMARYNPDKNADRISDALIAMFMLKENAFKEEVRATGEENSGFWNRELFNNSNQAAYSAGVTTAY